VLAASMMTGFVFLLQGIVPTESLSRTSLLLFVMGVAISGAIIYLGILIKLKVFSNQQLNNIFEALFFFQAAAVVIVLLFSIYL